ncbi:hypothetical protein Tco_1282582 [Tanacetum coccineum]
MSSVYRVILPTSIQTILDAPLGYIGLYTHCFSLANLRLPLNDFFCEAYDCEPSVELFHGLFNLCKAGSWLTFQKRSKTYILSLIAKVITRIKGWNQRFFFIQDTIVPSKFTQLFLKENMLDVKSFKDKLPSGIEQTPQFQRLGRYPVSARAFDDPILFLAGLQYSWEHGQQRPTIFVGGKETLSTPRKTRISLSFPMIFLQVLILAPLSVSINTEPVKTDEEPAVEPVNERVGTTANSGGSPKGDTFVVHTGSVASRIMERKCKTRGGSSRPLDDTPVLSISDDDEGLKDCLELKDATVCHLKIFAITPPDWKVFLDNHLDVDLLDLYDRCYARQAIVDNVVNRRSHKLLEVIEKLRGETDVMRARELAREEECEGLRAKCEAAMTDFDKNPAVLLLRENM